jgi:hypothetical protein
LLLPQIFLLSLFIAITYSSSIEGSKAFGCVYVDQL